MKNRIKLYLDMDGTIADLYNQENWLEDLRAEKCGIFTNLKPIITEQELLSRFPLERYDIRILSMTPRHASKPFCKVVKNEKNEWLDTHFPKLKKRIYQRYSNNKNLKGCANAILIDDNETIRNNWKGRALNPIELWG